jgi:hypothetical protein
MTSLNAMVERWLIAAASVAPRLSQPLCGTDATLGAVVKGQLALRRNRRRRRVHVAPEQAARVAGFREHGFCDLGSPFEPDLLDRVAAAFAPRVMDDRQCHLRYESNPDIHEEDRVVPSADGAVVQRTLLDPLGSIPQIRGVLSDSLVRFIEACYGCPVRLLSVTYWRNYHVPPQVSALREVGYSNYWHNDAHATDTVKLFVAMSDVSDEDGPLHVIPRPLTRRIIRRGFNRKQVRQADRFNSDAFRMVGPRGRAVLCNTTLCLHRAGVPAPGRSRDMLQFVFRAHERRDLDSAIRRGAPSLT